MTNSKEDAEAARPTDQGPPDSGEAASKGPESGETAQGGDPQSEAAEAAPGGSLSPADFEALKRKAEERDAYRNELLRAMADLDNYQKRVRKDRRVWEDQAVDRVLQRLLPILDDFERALGAAKKDGAGESGVMAGVHLIHQALLRLLVDLGIEEIDALGKDFNPVFHEAITEEVVNTASTGCILEVFQKGYRRGDAVLRASRVKVARNAASEDPEP